MIDSFFRQYFVFLFAHLVSCRVVHVGVTKAPTDPWVTQQLPEATPFAEAPQYLVRDNDSKFGVHFSRVANSAAIKQLKTPVGAPNANAIMERFLGSVRRAGLDHILIRGEQHWQCVVKAYVGYFNARRLPQEIQQRLPTLAETPPTDESRRAKIIVHSVLGGLHHSSQKVA